MKHVPTHTNSVQAQIFESFEDKVYRDAFVASHLRTNLAAQISSTREQRGWTQVELAERVGMAQARISVLEDPSYEGRTIKTLKRLASAFDVALIVRLVKFSELAKWAARLSPDDLAISEFADDSLIEIPQLPEPLKDWFETSNANQQNRHSVAQTLHKHIAASAEAPRPARLRQYVDTGIMAHFAQNQGTQEVSWI